MVKDMTKGSPVKMILYFALPMLVGNVFQQLYNIVDSIVVSRGVGVDAFASVGCTGSMNFFIIGFILASILFSFYNSKLKKELKQTKRQYEKKSIGADDSSLKIKTLENKIQTLESALKKSLNKD